MITCTLIQFPTMHAIVYIHILLQGLSWDQHPALICNRFQSLFSSWDFSQVNLPDQLRSYWDSEGKHLARTLPTPLKSESSAVGRNACALLKLLLFQHYDSQNVSPQPKGKRRTAHSHASGVVIQRQLPCRNVYVMIILYYVKNKTRPSMPL